MGGDTSILLVKTVKTLLRLCQRITKGILQKRKSKIVKKLLEIFKQRKHCFPFLRLPLFLLLSNLSNLVCLNVFGKKVFQIKRRVETCQTSLVPKDRCIRAYRKKTNDWKGDYGQGALIIYILDGWLDLG